MFSFLKREKKTTPRACINVLDDNYVREFIIEWNNRYPVDRWWRNKHKVAFNSSAHRVVSFLDMRLEFEEDQMFSELEYSPIYKSGDWLRVKTEAEEDLGLTQEEKYEKYKKEFEEMDLSKYVD